MATVTSYKPRRNARRFSLTGLGLTGGGPNRAFLGVARILMLWALALFFGLPMLWLVLAPSKTNSKLATMPPISFGSFGNYWTSFHNLVKYNSGIYVNWIANSVIYVAASVAIGLVLCIFAGYALAIFRFRGRSLLLTLTLVSMIMPSAAFVLPLFLEMSLFHLLNSAWSVILPSGFFPFGTYLSYVYFSGSLPPSIVEASRVDGASELRILMSVAVPLAKPLVSLVAFFAFVSEWNNFFLVQVMITSVNRFNIQTGMASLLSGAFMVSSMTPSGVLRPELAMAGILLGAPIVAFFLIIQRYLTAGLLAGYGVG